MTECEWARWMRTAMFFGEVRALTKIPLDDKGYMMGFKMLQARRYGEFRLVGLAANDAYVNAELRRRVW